MPDLRKLDPHQIDVPCLDVAELDGDGARAIVPPDSSVFSSTFIGVNKAFCSLFGYESCEFQSCPFTKLTGAITDTRQLQAMWQLAIRGSDESRRFDFCDKSGCFKSVTLDLLPRTLGLKHGDGPGLGRRERVVGEGHLPGCPAVAADLNV